MSAKQNVDVEVSQPADAHLMKETISGPQSNSGSDDGGEQRLQEGVQRIEAITSTWTVKALIITFLCIYLISFTDSLQYSVTGSLTPYVTSSFALHSLTATTGVMSGIIGGVAKLPIAKIIDIWGRIEGFMVLVVLVTFGLILMAVCQNVETYAAAQVFFWVGYNGIQYVTGIFVADTTSLLNRSIIDGLKSTPYIATTFAGPAIAQRFYEESSFRWAFGAFAIITPVVCAPTVFMFMWNARKAKKMGLITPRNSGRTWKQSSIHYFKEFDVIGCLLIVAGFALVLLPLNLAASSPGKWDTPWIIATIILGAVLLVTFGIWEKFFAPVSFLPFRYMMDRTILGSCLLAGTLFIAFYCWDIYFSSYLQVVYQLDIKDAGYILNIYSIGSCFIGPIIGLIMRWTGKFKMLAICAVPISAMSTGLLVYFRTPGTAVGYIIMCQIFHSFTGGTLVMCMQIAVMAAVPHNEVAVVSALLGLFSSIGGAIGQSIAAAIWTNMLPGLLEEYLPAESQDKAALIYASLETQLSYPWDSAIRQAIVQAYGEVQKKMLTAGVCFMPLAFASVLLWRNIDLRKIKQTKGTVF